VLQCCERKGTVQEWVLCKNSLQVFFEGQCYGVATMSRRLKIIGLFGRISSLLLGSFAKETYNFRSLLVVATPYGALRILLRCFLFGKTNVYIYIYIYCIYILPQQKAPQENAYGVATTSRLLKIMGLFCKRAL